MQPVRFSEHAKVFNSTIIGVVPVLAYVTVRHRNAWHSTESRRYQGDSALEASLAFAKLNAEDWRQRGSWFSIIETPALALLSREGALYCADFHRDAPFSGLDADNALRALRVGETVAAGARVLGVSGTWQRQPNEHSLLQGVDPFCDIQPVARESTFDRHSSIPQAGPRKILGWTVSPRANVRATSASLIADAVMSEAGLECDDVLRKYELLKDARTERMLTDFLREHGESS